MTVVTRNLLMTIALLAGAHAQAQDMSSWSVVPERDFVPTALPDRDELGLPGMRPRLTMNLPLGWSEPDINESVDTRSFSWSLETWQLNTASLAHIQCNSGRMTINSYLAEDCRFVEQPLPDDSVNLVQVRGNWTAAPWLNLGMSAFHSLPESRSNPVTVPIASEYLVDNSRSGSGTYSAYASEGLDLNVSFGIQTERVGDFLIGLQVARYRQRMGLSDLGLQQDHWAGFADDSTIASQYTNSAQLMLGWRRGSFSGEMLGHHRESPLWLSNEPAPSIMNTFDLEFSWHAPRNALISIGVSNVLDSSPRPEESASESRLDDPMESVFGRIPYVRYKQDL